MCIRDRLNEEDSKEASRQIKEMLDNKIIEPSDTAYYNSPVFLIKKKDGSRRFIVDLRGINSLIVPRLVQLPNIDCAGVTGLTRLCQAYPRNPDTGELALNGSTDKARLTACVAHVNVLYKPFNELYLANEKHARSNQHPTRNARSSACLLYTSPSPRDRTRSRMPSSA